MKRSLFAVMISLFLITLAACDDSSAGNKTGESGKNSSESVMEIYEKAIAAAEEIESAEVAVEADQSFGFDGDMMESSSNFTILMTMDPLTMHQKGTTTMAFGPDDEETMDIEMYMTDEDMYFYEGFSGQWINMGGEMSELLGDMAALDDAQDPYEQLKMFEDHIEHFDIETTGDAYILSLTIDADSFDEAFKEILEDTVTGDLEMILGDDSFDPFENMEIDALAYQITLDKDSLQLKGYDMKMDMTITEGDESMTMSQDLRSVYSKINEVGPIEIPQEVIDGAESLF